MFEYPYEPGSIAELIHRRRRQILIHSIIYYKYDTNIWTDDQFDKAAYELVELQAKYPEISDNVDFLSEQFKDFDGSTGYDLPLNDPRSVKLAKDLLDYKYRK